MANPASDFAAYNATASKSVGWPCMLANVAFHNGGEVVQLRRESALGVQPAEDAGAPAHLLGHPGYRLCSLPSSASLELAHE